jgi:Spy/CpxP family protein refolding chaperone
MNRWFCWVLGLGLALVLSAGTQAQEPKQPDRPPGGFTPGALARPLLPAQLLERLNLTEDQKEKIGKLQKEFTEKQKEAYGKLRELMEKAQRTNDEDARRQVKEAMQAAEKQRQEVEGKVKDILTGEQQRKYEELKKDLPAFGGYPPGGPGPGRPGYPMMVGPPTFFPGHVFPPFVQEMLKLTPEQREKINKLQKDAEEKMMEVLTEEQKKQLEAMKKKMTGGAGRPPAP